MDICLVNMPFDSGNLPSLGLGLLKARANADGLHAEVLYASLMFTRRIGPDIMKALLTFSGMSMLSSEAVFEPWAGYGECASDSEIEACLKGAEGYPPGSEKVFMRLLARCRQEAEPFLEEVCDRILALEPKIVGCTHFLLQLNASLALFKRLKEKRPDIITVLGGAGCSLYSGQAVADHMPQVDYVFCGESDDVFTPACRLMLAGERERLRREFPCVLQKGMRNGEFHQYRDLRHSVFPDYDDFFAELRRQGLEKRVQPLLPVEASRGCWWGKCNFCGLNEKDGSHYRFKPSERVAEELAYLSGRYGVKRFFFADCIMADVHLRQLKDLLAGKGYLMHTEVKTSMTYEELLGLRRAGFYWIVPGLESIHDGVLRHINKGNRAIKNIEFLKWCRIAGIDALWNLMYGFPAEEDAWYEEIVGLIPLLTHLKWPILDKFRYQRKSNYTLEKEKYGVEPVPHSMYRCFMGKDEAFHAAYAEYYEVPGARFAYEDRLRQAVRRWMTESMQGASLTYERTAEGLLIRDSRACAAAPEILLRGAEMRVCEEADFVISLPRLAEKLGAEGISADAFSAALESLREKKLTVRVGDEILFPALPAGFEKADTHESFMLWDMC